mgnify:CR=1 FL=1
MAKKLDVREYEAELIKVLDGDTIDCYIDLGFNLKTKKRISSVEFLEKSLYRLNMLGSILLSVLLILIVQLIYRLMVG